MEANYVDYEMEFVEARFGSKEIVKITFADRKDFNQNIVLMFGNQKLREIYSSRVYFDMPESFKHFLTETNSISFNTVGTLCECQTNIGEMIIAYDNDNIYGHANYLLIADPQFISGGAHRIYILSVPLITSMNEYLRVFKNMRCGIYNSSGDVKSKLIDCYNILEFSCG